MSKAEGIEKSIVSEWEGWDLIDTMQIAFYDATLKVGIGKFHAGDIVPILNIDFERSQVIIYDDEGNELAKSSVRLGLC